MARIRFVRPYSICVISPVLRLCLANVNEIITTHVRAVSHSQSLTVSYVSLPDASASTRGKYSREYSRTLAVKVTCSRTRASEMNKSRLLIPNIVVACIFVDY